MLLRAGAAEAYRLLADAVLDRLVHNAYRIELAGDSLRKHKAPAT